MQLPFVLPPLIQKTGDRAPEVVAPGLWALSGHSRVHGFPAKSLLFNLVYQIVQSKPLINYLSQCDGEYCNMLA